MADGGAGFSREILTAFRRVQLYRVSLVLLFLALWQLVASLPNVSPLLVASPAATASALLRVVLSTSPHVPDFYSNLQSTLYEIVIAFALAVAVGLPLGIALGSSKLLSDAYEPSLLAYLAFPHVVLFPILFLIFGIEASSKIALGFLIGFPYIAFNVSAGLKQTDQNLILLSRSLGYGYFSTLFKVAIPSSMPTNIGGLRIGFNHAFIGVIVAELINGNKGLGYLVNLTSENFATSELYVVILVTVLIGFLGDTAFRVAEQRSQRWKFRT